MIKDQSGFYWVKLDDGSEIVCQLRGILKKDAQSSDIATIGDRVKITRIQTDGEDIIKGVIESVEPRHSILSRAVRTSGKRGSGMAEREHIIIANATQALFVFSAQSPTPNFRMLDRMLIVGEKSQIPKIRIVVTKIDLDTENLREQWFEVYHQMDYQISYTSLSDQKSIDALAEILKDEISVLTGPSGVGKSSLLNALQTGLHQKVQSISDYSQEGLHTTRDSNLVELDQGGYLADTPGIRELQLWDIEPDELDAYFRDFQVYLDACRFRDCTHHTEPGCAIREAAKTGLISKMRYRNYLNLYQELKDTYIVY